MGLVVDRAVEDHGLVVSDLAQDAVLAGAQVVQAVFEEHVDLGRGRALAGADLLLPGRAELDPGPAEEDGPEILQIREYFEASEAKISALFAE